MGETEASEVGIDKLHGRTNEQAKQGKGPTSWLHWLALFTALFAVLATIASLKSTQLANKALISLNESTLKQAQASDAWSYYQAKGVKEVTRESEANVLTASHAAAEAIAKAQSEAGRYKSEQEDIQKDALKLEHEQRELADESRQDVARQHKFAYAVTVLQVAIGLSAIAALIELRAIWVFGLVCGIVGIGYLIAGFV